MLLSCIDQNNVVSILILNLKNRCFVLMIRSIKNQFPSDNIKKNCPPSLLEVTWHEMVLPTGFTSDGWESNSCQQQGRLVPLPPPITPTESQTDDLKNTRKYVVLIISSRIQYNCHTHTFNHRITPRCLRRDNR